MNKQADANYWIELQKDKALRGEKIFSKLETELFYLYDEATQGIINDTAALVNRFGTDNSISYSASLKLLSGKEYDIWKKSIDKYLADITVGSNPQLITELNTLAMKSRISRNDELLSNIYKNMINIAQDSEKQVSEIMSKLVETEFYKTSFSIQRMAGSLSLAHIDEAMIKNVLAFPWSGKRFSEAIWDNTEMLAQLTKRQLSIGFIAGHGVDKMAKAINDIMGKGKYNASRLVRTEGAYFQTQGSLLSYKDNRIEMYTYCVGSNTNDACINLAGKAFPLKDGVAGVNLPPMHPHCRCYIVPAFDDDYFTSIAKRKTGEDISYDDWLELCTKSSNRDNITDKLSNNKFNNIRDIVANDFDKLPLNHQNYILKQKDIEYLMTDSESGFSPAKRKLLLSKDIEPGDAIHEFGHVISESLNLYENKQFYSILDHHFGNIDVYNDIYEDTSYNVKNLRFIRSKYLVSEYQGRMYNHFSNSNMLLNLREYFSEGYRVYINDPTVLKEKDVQLFNFIKEMKYDF